MVRQSMSFRDLSEFRQVLKSLPAPDEDILGKARERNANLTKPPGSLGRLEQLAIWYASWRGEERPRIRSPQVIVFAGNHGVAARGISAYPTAVTEQMVANFRTGGAAINQLARQVGADVGVRAIRMEAPTGDISCGEAMTAAEFVEALQVGWDSIDSDADLVVPGEMGIGNTTSSAAVALALFGGTAEDWTGRGTGVEGQALDHKVDVVARAVSCNRPFGPAAGLDVLRKLGGREMAAIAGAVVKARTLRIPVVLDGFICSVAVAAIQSEAGDALEHTVAGHCSAEAGHSRVLARLGKEPLLDLGMRLGEGSGAALAAQVLISAVACHSGMATFREASVAGSIA